MTSGARATSSAAYLQSRRHGPGPARLDPQVAADYPAQLPQPLQKRPNAGLASIVCVRVIARRCAVCARPAAPAP